ncbi:6-phosphogluconolactonase [Sediminispirochaeta bajacaliforniensis]|uniref:6-phosphogluconolactonase n=1 Tax=Sediminispirochaeta bajacaliforniensis TaxID=148 RepID=UPI000380007D|nr:6-phosphogluconolactonase [Sediminispirochaeta bajacaliforniensis]
MNFLAVQDADHAARLIYGRIEALVSASPYPVVVAVPGGTSPLPLFHLWRDEGKSRGASFWEPLVLIQADERIVPQTHPDSNARLIREHLTGGWEGLEQRFHPFPPDADPRDFLVQVLGSGSPGSDERLAPPTLTLLGLGNDGHVASLFPCCPTDWKRREEAFISESPNHPHRRITLSFPWINAGSEIVLLALGEKKRTAIARFLSGDDSVPAVSLARNKLTLVSDIVSSDGRLIGPGVV